MKTTISLTTCAAARCEGGEQCGPEAECHPLRSLALAGNTLADAAGAALLAALHARPALTSLDAEGNAVPYGLSQQLRAAVASNKRRWRDADGVLCPLAASGEQPIVEIVALVVHGEAQRLRAGRRAWAVEVVVVVPRKACWAVFGRRHVAHTNRSRTLLAQLGPAGERGARAILLLECMFVDLSLI